MDFFDALPDYSTELYVHKKMKTTEENSLEALGETIPVLESLESWTYEAIHDALIGLAEKLALKNGRIMWPVRTALSGKAVTPGDVSGAGVGCSKRYGKAAVRRTAAFFYFVHIKLLHFIQILFPSPSKSGIL